MKLRKLMPLALLLGVLVAPPASAGPVIDWDPAFVYGPGASTTTVTPGAELRGVGIVSLFDGQLGDLDANDPNTEYTFIFRGLIAQPTVVTGPPAYTFYTTNYTGGIIELYAGSPRNSSFAPNPENAIVPSTFQDGTLLLSGTFTSFYVQTNNFTAYKTGNMEGNILWSGGTRLSSFNGGNGQPCPGLFTGGLTWLPSVLIPGYVFRHDGKIDLNCPVPASPSTWGRLKSQYRD
ncbi:MAG: hypothetical protein ABI960_02695 [Candidatus Eisenbacteria bacterium]